MKLDVYDVDKKYIQFLQQREREKRGLSRVPNMEYGKRQQKFVCGSVLTKNGMNYYAPVSSNKTSRNSSVLIVFENDSFDKIKGSLNLAYMFPIPKCAIEKRNIKKEETYLKRKFLNKELAVLRNKKEEIQNKANDVYRQVIKGKSDGFRHVCCDFSFLEKCAKEWEKEKMKEQDREIYYISERLGIGDFLDYKQSLDRLEMGVSLGMEAFIDKEGKFYSQYDLEEMFKNISIDEEDEFTEKKGIKKCFIEIKDVEDCQFFQSKYVSNCIINPAVMDLNTSRKFNRTIEVLTDPLYCFNKEKCSQIKKELMEAKPLNALKLDSFTKKYIDDKALETLKIVVNNPKVYEGIVKEIDWSYIEKLNLKNRENEIIWGSELEGADDYAKDLEVAQETSRDIDKADIPNNTPEERSSIKNEIKKAKLIKEEHKKAESKVVKIAKKEIEK